MAVEKNSLFLQFFGDSARFRMIDFLLENRLSGFTKTEIAAGAGISWASLFNHWEKLEQDGMVKVTRKVGRVRLYQLNDRSPVVQQLKNIEMALIKAAADEEEDAVSMKVRARAKTKN
jgi:DNA-binding transcriptional ArsR family regulator